MRSTVDVTQKELPPLLLNVAVVRPVFLWGQPGIGKSALVSQFAASLGLDCVSLLGSQLAPEDVLGVPQIVDGTSVFRPPRQLARAEPYCLFLDELNACSHEVQKAFYSLIHERRVGEYHLPEGSIVIGAGNRAQDSAIVRPMSSALLNRMMHVHLRVSSRDWLEWAASASVDPLILEYIGARPDHLFSAPPKTEEPFSTPRSWHMLSDCMKEHADEIPDARLRVLAYGCLTPHHAGQFLAFVKKTRRQYTLEKVLDGKQRWPGDPEDRDVLYFLAQSLRARLVRELPAQKGDQKDSQKQLAFQAKGRLKELAALSLEMAQVVVSQGDDGEVLPGWFMVEVVRDLPRLADKNRGS